MRFSNRDRDILARIGLYADSSLRDLARLSGYQIHSVRHLLDRLKAQGLIKKAWVIDPLRLGWERYHILFSTAKPLEKKQTEFISYFVNSSRVTSFSELAGDFDYQLNFLML